MSSPVISIIIPAYNCDQFLAQTLESILDQDFQDYELILVDDGSVDRTLPLMQEYALRDGRIRVFHQENLHCGVARNTGLDHARGEFIVFHDGDDIMAPGALGGLLERIRETGADMVLGQAESFSQDMAQRMPLDGFVNTDLLPEKDVFTWQDVPDRLFQLITGAVWGKIYRHEFIRQKGLRFDALPRTEDVSFSMGALALAGAIAVYPHPAVYYRAFAGSGSLEDRRDRNPTTNVDAFLELYDFLEDHQIALTLRRSLVSALMVSVGWSLQAMGTGQGFIALADRFMEAAVPRLGIQGTSGYDYLVGAEEMIQDLMEAGSGAQCLMRRMKAALGQRDEYCRQAGQLQAQLTQARVQFEQAQAQARFQFEQAQAQARFQFEQAQALHRSWSYRIGRKITFLPGKMKRWLK